MNKAAKAYFQTKITTTDQGDLLIMLYDAAIKFLNQAKTKMKEKDYAAKGIAISRAMDIVNELTSSLNKERGGDISKNLADLYLYCTSRLLKANLRMDTDMVDEVINILSGLRSAFAEIVPQFSGKMPAMTAQSTPIGRAAPAAPAGMNAFKKPAMASIKSYAQNQKTQSPDIAAQPPAQAQAQAQAKAPTKVRPETKPDQEQAQKQQPAQIKPPVQFNAMQQNRMAAAYKQKVANYGSGS